MLPCVRVKGDPHFMSRAGLVRALGMVVAGLAAIGGGGVRAQDDPAVGRGIQFLRAHAGNQQVGETAMIALAMLKAEMPTSDPTIRECVARVRARFTSGGYSPERQGGHDIYEAAVVAMMLSNLESEARRYELNQVAQYLTSHQNANGSWDYSGRTAGDTSISQYAVLGLWEADNGGARISPRVWDRAAQWFLSVQNGGSWNYHRDDVSYPETISMTAAGVGSLLICRRQLDRYRRSAAETSPLLTSLAPEGREAPYEPKTSSATIDQAVRRGMSWLAGSFTTQSDQVVGPSVYYGLYGIERIAALADKAMLGRVNWLEDGRRFIHSSQRADGAWTSTHGDELNTVWAILFLTRSTAKSIRRVMIQRLGAGTLLGGRGLPQDLSSMTVAGGRVVSRPMNGAVEGMLAVLEDPRAQQADSALSGLVARFEAEGPTVLRPYKDRFRKLLVNRDPGLRRVAAWALGRTGELDAVPVLIDALTDPDEEVVAAARLGLQLLSRKIDGLGPPSPSTPEQRAEAARKWRAWYETTRPLELEGQEDADAKAARRPGSAQ